jgi:hypothetical protein
MRANFIAALFLSFAFFGVTHNAQAYNVPGTGNLLLAPTTRIAANAVASSARDCALGAGSMQVAPSISVRVDGSANFLKSTSGPLRYEYDIESSTACFSRGFVANTATLQVGAALNYEYGNGKTEFNRGTLKQGGVGGSLFAAVAFEKSFRVFLATGFSDIAYEMTRGSGAIGGNFGSHRTYVAGGLSNRVEFSSFFLSGVTDVRYVNATFAAYHETGTAFGISAAGWVPASTIDMVLLTGEYRIGLNEGRLKPYFLSGFSHDFLRSPDLVLPTGGTISLADSSKTLGFAGGGIQSTFGGVTNLGIEGRYSIDTQHNTVLSVVGRLSAKF